MKTKQLDFLKLLTACFVSYNIPFETSAFLACLFALESNYGESDLAKGYHNYCGMKVPFLRLSCCVNFKSCNDTFAHYKSLNDCVADFVLWLATHSCMRVDFEHPVLLRRFMRFYCPDSDYFDKINLIYKRFKSLNYGRN